MTTIFQAIKNSASKYLTSDLAEEVAKTASLSILAGLGENVGVDTTIPAASKQGDKTDRRRGAMSESKKAAVAQGQKVRRAKERLAKGTASDEDRELLKAVGFMSDVPVPKNGSTNEAQTVNEKPAVEAVTEPVSDEILPAGAGSPALETPAIDSPIASLVSSMNAHRSEASSHA